MKRYSLSFLRAPEMHDQGKYCLFAEAQAEIEQVKECRDSCLGV